ncbi:PdxA family dehydrogenase [Burkholderia gladioli]|uniref:PdxA family dehydrogenase n=1 Tax=Burkholderia gladioli TaxID=28095 RepID=UPI002FE114CF
MHRPRIAIALGDPAGIGPEIALKAALDARVRQICDPLLVGDADALAWHARACGIDARIHAIAEAREAVTSSGRDVTLLALDQFSSEPLEVGKIAAAHGRAAIEAARVAIEAAMAGAVDAVVACPKTEYSIKEAGIEFDGYPSFVARCTGTPADDAFLMLCFDTTRIVHTTLHVSLRRALELVTEERVLRVLQATHAVLSRNGGAARIAVAGLNPHASEHGMFGDDEARIIEPALKAARELGIDADGPFGADTMFQKSGYDAFVVMYHDQGHIAAKLLATNRTAGMTIGTPVLFSSVAHGSALDIAGGNRANPEAVVEAVHRLVSATRAERQRV